MNYPIPKRMNYPITGKKNKYKNTKIELEDKIFESKKEGRRYLDLRTLERAGTIKKLKTQVKFELQPSFKIDNKTIRKIEYVADFTYEEDGKLIVEDVKGFKTDIYRLKKKMFAYKYKTEIKEV